MRQKRSFWLAWLLCLFCVVGGAVNTVVWMLDESRHQGGPATEALVWGWVAPILFSVVAALILARQPRNLIGWLLMLPAITTVIPTESLLVTPPAALTPGIWLLLWFNGWSWIPLIFSIFLIPLNFPTGRPPSRRWNWVNWLALGMWLVFMLLATVADPMEPLNYDWTIPNPLAITGFDVKEAFFNAAWFMTAWGIGLMTILFASTASLFVRYRRGAQVERQQIKWLLYAGLLFAIAYPLSYITSEGGVGDWVNILVGILFIGSILAFVPAIAIAILRYRLYDIDILIRRTLQYSVLTGLLAIAYFGGVVTLQGILSPLTGSAESPLVTVITTLGIAALFTPLRRRVQAFIDRRFYRKRYDAEQTLANFALIARDEVDMDKLAAALIGVVDETMQPETVSLWLAQEKAQRSS
jgi:hypothetical protein